MKNLLIVGLILFTDVLCLGQEHQQRTILPEQKQDKPAKMTAEMTEIWDPEVKIVQPGEQPWMPPSDAIILFDGSDINKEWIDRKGDPPKWAVTDGAIICVPDSGDIQTKRKFTDFQLHIEWRTPSEAKGKSQERGNSGVFLQGLYEVQVLDNYNNRTYRNGQAGSIYKQHVPLVNACRKPGEWQTYDIIYTAPRFAGDSAVYFTPPRVTVIHNGVLIQNNVSLRGPTLYEGIPEYSVKKHGAEPLMLQDHDNPIAYRNIWIREL